MARYDFGGTLADFVVTSHRLGTLDTLALSAATLTMWSAQSGGTRYTDLVLNGSSVSSIVVGSDGQVPKFQGPDGVTEMWADGGSARIRIVTLQGAPGPAGPPGVAEGNILLDTDNVPYFDPTATGSIASNGSIAAYVAASGPTKTALDATYSPLVSVGTTATSSATLAASRHTPVDATSAARTMTLPTAPAGTLISVEKTDASTNAVTVTGTMRGVASSIALAVQYDARTFLSEGAGSWRPVSDHRTTASLLTSMAPLRRGVSVKEYGAKGDGVTDDTTAFQNAYNAAAGQEVFVPTGAYNLPGKVTGSLPLHLRGEGSRASTILRPAGAAQSGAFQIKGSRGAAVSLTADAVAGTRTIVLANATGIAEGDYVMIRSQAAWPGDPTKGAQRGEIVRVESVSANTLTTRDGLEDNYAVADTAIANKMTMVQGSSLTGVGFVNTAPPLTKQFDYGVYFEYVAGLVADDVLFSLTDGPAFELPNVVGFQGSRLFFDRLGDSDALGIYGYGVDMRDSSRDFLVSDSIMMGGRHLFTTNAYGVGGTAQGIPRRATVANSLAVGTTNAGFDTHPEGAKVRFVNCTVRQGRAFGFHLRAQETEVFNGLVDGSIGPAVWVRSQATGSSVDVSVRDAKDGSVDGTVRQGRGVMVDPGALDIRFGRVRVRNTDGAGVYLGDGCTFHAEVFDVDTPGRTNSGENIGVWLSGTHSGDIIESLRVKNATSGLFGQAQAAVEVRHYRSSSVSGRYAGGITVSAPRVAAKSTLYYAADVPGTSTATQGQSTLKACPFIVDRRITIDRIGLEVSTAVAASTVRIGIYRDTGDGYPGTLVLEAPSTIDASTIGYKDVNISQTLDPGVYWLAGVSQGGDPGLRVNTGASRFVGITAGATVQGCAYVQSGVTGALPATWSTSVASSQSGHHVMVRLA